VDQILDVLKKDNVISAWLGSDENRDPELFVLLADKLPQSERDALTDVAHVVISKKDNLAARISTLERENQHLRSLSLTDGLTGLYNYRFFAKQLKIEMARTKRTGQPCSLIMIDLDDFKLLNDTRGHDEGNKYLVTVSQVILEKLRPTDILCRYGGDEFAIIMPATYLFDAMLIARRLRNAITQIPPRLDVPFSASLGLAEYDPSSGQEMGVFVNAADKALYRAKKGGKNKICHEGRLPKMGKAASVTQDEKAALLSEKKG
jgi:diguanylate cyclase (GGDEF)-like protein